MKPILSFLICTAFAAMLLLEHATQTVQGQGIQPASVNFRNETPIPVIVQGMSLVGGTLRKGQPLLIGAGKNAWDHNVPPGIRQYKIYDATQPSKVLNPSVSIRVLDRDQFFLLRPVKGGAVEVIPELSPKGSPF